MMRVRDLTYKLVSCFTIAAVVATLVAPPSSAATVSPTLKEAQAIMKKFTIPTGPVDGKWGPQTAQGLCTFRQLSGLPSSRGALNKTDLATLRAYGRAYSNLGAIPQPSRAKSSSYMYANLTCQTMTYVKNNRATKVMKISSGIAGHRTPTGTYRMGYTQPGWSCSTIYGSNCQYNYVGENAQKNTKSGLYSRWGNMYNKRSVKGAILVHGSTSVPTYPASHGCIRVTVSDSDWMWHNVNPMPIIIAGAY